MYVGYYDSTFGTVAHGFDSRTEEIFLRPASSCCGLAVFVFEFNYVLVNAPTIQKKWLKRGEA